MNEYDKNFLGVTLELPSFTPARIADILPSSPQLPGGVATYPNYAVVTDKKLRAPAFAVLHIDQDELKKTARSDTWKIDSRIGAEWQLDDAYYRDNPWDKGHMADRESAGWGASPADAQASADQTFYYANACLQHKNLNEDEWLALETWVMKLPSCKDGRLTVFTGPIYGENPRIITPAGLPPATVPVGFFKVICFVNSGSGELGVRAFIIYQDVDALRDMKGRKAFNYTKYQVTITEIEQLTELRFPDEVRDKNPLFYHPATAGRQEVKVDSFPERIDINQREDVIHDHKTRRIAVKDDEVEVYIAAALICPGAGMEEWVSLANYENKAVSIKGWKLKDGGRHELKLNGSIPAGGTVVLSGAKLRPVCLPDKGGVLTLFNDKDERIDREDYSKDEATALRRADGKNQPLNFHNYRLGLKPRYPGYGL